jgi:hypothetical protein
MNDTVRNCEVLLKACEHHPRLLLYRPDPWSLAVSSDISFLLHHVAEASSIGPSPPDGLSFNLLSSPHLTLGLLPIPIIILVRSIDLQTNLDTQLSLCYPFFPLPIVSIRRLHLLLITQHLSSSFARLSPFARCMYELCGVTPAAVLLWLSFHPWRNTICCSERKEGARHLGKLV